ncbi:MAG: prolipoprotein diacylglyceryl transferase [Patescibacteria group bacterium]|jgi:phosphatidylglycerol:prolipoprotein diacylglycerol transferase
MLPYFNFQKIALGPVNLQIWGIFFALALIVSSIIFLKNIQNKHINSDAGLEFIIWLIISIIVGARVGYVISHLNEYKNIIDIFKIWQGGLAMLGGLIGGLVAAMIFARYKKINFFTVADSMAPAVAVGIAIGRTGCYLVGEHLGKATNFFLGVKYNNQVVHQTALYEIFISLIIFAILTFLSKKKLKSGAIFTIFLLLYAIGRFIIEYFRINEPAYLFFTYTQWICLIIIIISAAIVKRRSFLKS